MEDTLSTTLPLLNNSKTTASFQTFTTATTAQTVQLTTIQSWTEVRTGNTSTNLVSIILPVVKNEPSQLSDSAKIGIGIGVVLFILFLIFIIGLLYYRKFRCSRCTTQQEKPVRRPAKPNSCINALPGICDVESIPGLLSKSTNAPIVHCEGVDEILYENIAYREEIVESSAQTVLTRLASNNRTTEQKKHLDVKLLDWTDKGESEKLEPVYDVPRPGRSDQLITHGYENVRFSCVATVNSEKVEIVCPTRSSCSTTSQGKNLEAESKNPSQHHEPVERSEQPQAVGNGMKETTVDVHTSYGSDVHQADVDPNHDLRSLSEPFVRFKRPESVRLGASIRSKESGYASRNSTYEKDRFDEEAYEGYYNDGLPMQSSELEKESLAFGRDGIVELRRHLQEIKSDLSSGSEYKSFLPSAANKIAAKPELIVENEIIGAHCCEPDTERVVFPTSTDPDKNVGKLATQSQEVDIEEERRRATCVTVEMTVGVFFDNQRKQFRVYWARKTVSVETKIEKVESKRSSYLTTPWMLFVYTPRRGDTLMQLKMVVDEKSIPEVLQEKMIAFSERQVNTVSFNYCSFDLPQSCGEFPHGLRLLISQGDYAVSMGIAWKNFENPDEPSIEDNPRYDSGFGSSRPASIVSDIIAANPLSVRGADSDNIDPPVTTQLSVALPYGLNTEQVPREIHDEIIKFERSKPEVGKQAQSLFNLTIGLFDQNGGVLVLKGDEKVTLTVPEGAIDGEQLIYIYADLEDLNKPQVDECLYSPEIDCGPDGTIFQKPVVLTIPHCAINPEDIEPQSRSCDGTDYTDFDSSCDNEVIRFQLIHFTRQRGRKQSSRKTDSHSSCEHQSGLILALGIFQDKNELRVYQTKFSDLNVQTIEEREVRTNSTLVALWNQFPYDHEGSELLVKFFHGVEGTMPEEKCIDKRTVERTYYSYVRFTLPVNYKKCSVTIEQTHPGEESPTKVELFEKYQNQAQARADDDDNDNDNGGEVPLLAGGDMCYIRPISGDSGFGGSRRTTANSTCFRNSLTMVPIEIDEITNLNDDSTCFRNSLTMVPTEIDEITNLNDDSTCFRNSLTMVPTEIDEITNLNDIIDIELVSDSTLDPFSSLGSDHAADNQPSSTNQTQPIGQGEHECFDGKPNELSEWMDSPSNNPSSPSNEKPADLTVNELGNAQEDDLSLPSAFHRNNSN